MTLKELDVLDKKLTKFRKEFLDWFEDKEYQDVYEAGITIRKIRSQILQTPEG